MRLDKLLVHSLVGSRHEVRGKILMGLVTVDGKATSSPGAQVDPAAIVMVEGEQVFYREHRYVMLHKPENVVSARKDTAHRAVLDLLPDIYARLGVAPVGRLDIDTTGLLLLTDDGALAHRLLSPKKHVPKLYEATTDKPLSPEAVERFREGIVLSDFTCESAELEIMASTTARITLYEGKFHQVKRMLAACGLETLALRRLSMGPLSLDPTLSPGQWRELTDAEESALRAL